MRTLRLRSGPPWSGSLATRGLLIGWLLAMTTTATTTTACASGATAGPGGAGGELAVPEVWSPPGPAHGVSRLELEELWRIGGEDEEILLGVISRVMADAGGRLYLLDSQLSTVSVFSPDGEFIRTIGREGEGPGEIQRPGDMLFMPGDRLGLVRTMPGRVVMLDLDGNAAGELRLGAEGSGPPGAIIQGHYRGGVLIFLGMRQRFDGPVWERHYFLSSVSESGTILHTFAENVHRIDFANVVIDESKQDFVWGRWDIGDDGNVYVAPERDRYRIDVFTPDGAPVRRFGRAATPRPRSDEDRRRVLADLKVVYRHPRFRDARFEILDHDPAIQGFQVRPDGEVWVLAGDPGGDPDRRTFRTYDVFDVEGRYTRRIELILDGNPLTDQLFLVSADRAVLVTGFRGAAASMAAGRGSGVEEAGGADEPGEPEVVCYRIGPPGRTPETTEPD